MCTSCNSIIFTQSTEKKLFFVYKEFFPVDHGFCQKKININMYFDKKTDLILYNI